MKKIDGTTTTTRLSKVNNNKISDAGNDNYTNTQEPIVVKKYHPEDRSYDDENNWYRRRRLKLIHRGSSSNCDSHDSGTHIWRGGQDVDTFDNVTYVVDDNHRRRRE
jgi:hypothetical protein